MNLRSSMIYAITNEFTNECEKQISSFLPHSLYSFVHLLCPKIYPENFLSGFHHQSSIARQGILQRKASQEIGSFAVAHRRAMEKASRNLKEIRCRAVTRPRPNIADERLRKEGRNKKTDKREKDR